jgi:PPM family protein phosphatase
MSGLRSFGKSDIGLRRSNNEDIFIADPDWGLFAVGDGMGGAVSGEVASRIFAETVVEIFSNGTLQSEEEALDLVKEALRSANERILNRARENPDHKGMGCTAELVFFYNQKYFLGHVGDSRTYLFRQGSLKQITRDHSLVQDQIDRGIITKDAARSHSMRNVILRAVGINEALEVDLIRGRALPGDIFLLCSDGLTDSVEDSHLEETLSLPGQLQQKVDRLIELAKSAGGNDNITVVLCELINTG